MPVPSPTLSELVNAFLAQHEASPARMRVLVAMLEKACAAFGDRRPAEVGPGEIQRWRAQMSAPTRWQATQALRQVGRWAARWRLVEQDPFVHLANPAPRAMPARPFVSWSQLDQITAELPLRLSLLPLLGAGAGLRPSELLAVRWSDIDLERGVLTVRATLRDGVETHDLKTARSRRLVPLRDRVRRRLDESAGEGLVCVAAGGGVCELHNLRRREWLPAQRRAGIEPQRRIYDLRHTYATWSLRAGIGIYQLARRMGTSVEMIDRTYGHLAADAVEHETGLLDAWDRAQG